MKYIVNTENALEAARRMNEDFLMTQHTGLLPSGWDLEASSDVLVLKCGLGMWALEIARTYHVKATGADTSLEIISRAMQLKQVENSQVNFVHLHMFPPLDFPDASFDLVHAC